MRQFTHTIQDALGIHARPAGLLLSQIKEVQSEVTITCRDKTASAKRLFALMGLGVRCGDTVTVSVEGTDEDSVFSLLQTFFHDHL